MGQLARTSAEFQQDSGIAEVCDSLDNRAGYLECGNGERPAMTLEMRWR